MENAVKSPKLGPATKCDPVEAHKRAREAVAADPTNEAAALELLRVVRSFPIEKVQRADPLANAAPTVREAASLLKQDNAEEAEILLRRHLSTNRDDVIAMKLMADIAMRFEFFDNAEKILRRALQIDPSNAGSWIALAKLLHRVGMKEDRVERVNDAFRALATALQLDPGNEVALSYQAAMFVQIRRLEDGRRTFEQLVAAHPESSRAWMNYSYLLKTMGRHGESVAAYRTSLALDPANSGAWWGLANLKIVSFLPTDIEEMETALEQEQSEPALTELHFALAAAYEQAKNFEKAASHLARGNEMRLAAMPHDCDQISKDVDAMIDLYTPAFFVKRTAQGDPSNAPIFIVGMPRSGSTLLEQILSSHSMIEGTEELFAMQQLGGELVAAHQGLTTEEALVECDGGELLRLGGRYLELTKFHRRTERPRFTDKNPANWRNVGLIRTILPNAKIIDARRDPMDCCFANYRQHYNWGINFSYGQREMAHQYRQYLRAMRHFDIAAPGFVHHVIHDDLVDNFEEEVRRLLDYLNLPFEESCLRFHENKRAVHTPSAEQVRQPINRSGFGRWRNYEPWLGELKEALGSTREDWRS